MSIQIHINGENADEAIRELSVLASHLTPSAGTAPAASAPAPEAPKTRSRKPAEPSVKDETPAPKEDEPAADPEPAAEAEREVMTEPVVTVEELRAKAAEVSKSGKQADVKALLQEFGAASISSIPEDKRAAFMSGLAGLA